MLRSEVFVAPVLRTEHTPEVASVVGVVIIDRRRRRAAHKNQKAFDAAGSYGFVGIQTLKVLFVHQNFPGQYLHIAKHLSAIRGNQVVCITQRAEGNLPGVKKLVYKPKRSPAPHTHHYIRETEAGVLNAQQVARAALSLKESGFVPDVMLGHNGWGEIWYLKDVFPKTPLIGYFEFFYRAEGADIEFESTIAQKFDTAPRIRTKNIGNLLGLETADFGQCPTRWQQSLYPERYHSMLRVVHEGIDTRTVAPNAGARLRLPNLELSAGDEIVTYVARNLEPYRGFSSFMRSLPEILRRRPNAQVVVVGGDDVSYGAHLPAGKTYKQELLKELGDSLDLERVHFLGKVPYPTFLAVLQVSRVHVYLTYPFVLSWSMLEAMSSGCLVVGSKTPPVQEVIRHQDNGLLVDFFDVNEIANTVTDALSDPEAYRAVRERARRSIIEGYDLRTLTLPAQLRLINEAAEPQGPYLWKQARS
jgi:glycosyltransferase involved in cell wall biosynthesis